jgi:hypothetical protein
LNKQLRLILKWKRFVGTKKLVFVERICKGKNTEMAKKIFWTSNLKQSISDPRYSWVCCVHSLEVVVLLAARLLDSQPSQDPLYFTICHLPSSLLSTHTAAEDSDRGALLCWVEAGSGDLIKKKSRMYEKSARTRHTTKTVVVVGEKNFAARKTENIGQQAEFFQPVFIFHGV